MLTLITATPGSGKTLKALAIIFDFLNDGRNVWTNIDGINISGVRKFEDDLENPFDWRKLDHGSVVLYDEAQKHPAFAKRDMLKKYPKDRAEDIANIAWDLDYHRHNGYDIVLITQSPKLINQHTLDFVGEHLHLRRVFGLKQATIFHFPEHKLNPNTRSVRDEAINKETFKFPKHLFKFYKSATQHTHKTKIPLKYIAILIAVFVGIPSYVYSKWKDDKILNSQNTVIEDSNQPVKAQAPMDTLPVKQTAEKEIKALDLEQQELSRIAMIIDSSTDCYAKNSYGDIVDITINECRALSSKNNRMSFSKVKKEQYLQENVSVNSNENIDYKPPTYPNL
ncbi:MAG: zonular occludens toxin domain-containing protein [Acinetobacter sp.]|uniref:zonular occludens toxin domain-containing protein n=1 Tax=Acinetobacter sp. TaxID=472 RepID=UPI00261FC020|nr:zonular occludens toxin domain-containing protein [Acinetobacter sp.]MDD2946252.1 zonular occludens toxin domain-containing protein [Acinetobacter sp.]